VVARFARRPRCGFRFFVASSLFQNETFRAAASRARLTDKKEIAGEEK